MGQFVMTWHDGRFARHSRFRYWLLDTSLRAMAPTLKHVFLKTHAAAVDYTLEDLQDPQKRKDLVSQMSTSTSKMPGSVGERRTMHQKLEGMVNQIEAETADQGEHAYEGRIPGGFCTLTCPVYKWEQLFDVVLRSYPSGKADDPDACEYYTQWKRLSLGAGKGHGNAHSILSPLCEQSCRGAMVLRSQAGAGVAFDCGRTDTTASFSNNARIARSADKSVSGFARQVRFCCSCGRCRPARPALLWLR